MRHATRTDEWRENKRAVEKGMATDCECKYFHCTDPADIANCPLLNSDEEK